MADTLQGHLLLIENNEEMRGNLSGYLIQLGYTVTIAESEDRAVELLGASKIKQSPLFFDMILLGMGINEDATIRLMQKIEADHDLHHIPEVVITEADDMDKIARYIEELGVEDYIRLPFHPVLWRARIESNLNKKRLHEQQKLKQEEIRNTLLPLMVDLSAEKNLDRLLESILEKSKQVCNADAGALYLRDEDMLNFVVVRNDSLNLTMGGTTGVPISFESLHLHDEAGQPNHRNVASYVALEKHSVNIPDIYHSQKFDFSGLKEVDKQLGYRSVSNLTVPLKNHVDEVVGVLQLINAQNPATGLMVPFDHDQQVIVESLSSQAAMLVDNQMLVERQKTWAKFERDLQIGHQIQIDFLPKQLPQPEGWDIAAKFLPAREVAGDFYDAFTLPGGKVALVIADVCDKGVGPALFMALSRSLTRAFAEQHRPLSWMEDFASDQPTAALNINRINRNKFLSAGTSALVAVELTNNYIAYNHGDMNMFATMFFGVLDPVTGRLTYINGGHDAPAVVAPDGTIKTRLKATGPAVGMIPDADFDIQQVMLEPGDLLMCFSDGVPDARNPKGKRFMVEHFLTLLNHQIDPSASVLLDRIQNYLYEHISTADQFDDITMLAVRHVSIQKSKKSSRVVPDLAELL